MQGFNDVALAVAAVTALAQGLQVGLKCSQFSQPGAHMAQVFVECQPRGVAVGLDVQIKPQQTAHLAKRHVHGPAKPYEAQLVNIAFTIKTIAVVAAPTSTEQLFLLIKANIGAGDPAQGGSLADSVRSSHV